jgi:hypothetical protein
MNSHDLKVCGDGTLIQILSSWILLTFLFYLKHNVSETGFCLCHLVKPTQFGPIDGASPYLRPTEQDFPGDGVRIQSPKCLVLNKNRTIGNIQKRNICMNSHDLLLLLLI